MMRHCPVAQTLALFCLSIALLLIPGCGSSSHSNTTSNTTASASFPQIGHAVLVMEENHDYSEVIGNSSMPYLNSLASQYGLATQYYANVHGSIGDYFMLTAGQVITSDHSLATAVSDDNIVRELLTAGKNWKSYAENLPSVGYTGGDVYPYAKRHNILAYFTDVADNSSQVKNLVPFAQFASDLNNNQLPNFSLVVPNLLDDAHD